MRCQISFNVISLFILVLLIPFNTLKAKSIPFTASSTEECLATTEPNETSKHDSAETAKLSAALIGKWECPNFMLEDMNSSRFLKYTFRADGSYSKVLGGAEVQIEEKGTWSLSKDGNQLIMKSKTLCDGQLITSVANIKHLLMDEMVLEQTMCVADTVVSAVPKTFYFNKI